MDNDCNFGDVLCCWSLVRWEFVHRVQIASKIDEAAVGADDCCERSSCNGHDILVQLQIWNVNACVAPHMDSILRRETRRLCCC